MSGLRDALLCQLAALGLRFGATSILLPLAVAFFTVFSALVVRRLIGRAPTKEGAPTRGPHWVLSSWCCVALYGLGRMIDPLMHGRLPRPAELDDATWERIGYFEWRLFGGSPLLRLLLPLADQPAIALVLHTVLWGTLFALLAYLLSHFGPRLLTRAGTLAFDQPEDDLPFYFRWIGATTARRADYKTRAKLKWIVAALVLAHGVVGGLLAAGAPAGGTSTLTCAGEDAGLESAPVDLALEGLPPPLPLPSPGAFVIVGLALAAFSLHLVTEGRPRAEPEEKKSPSLKGDEVKPRGTVERLAESLEARGITTSDWRAQATEAREGQTAPPPVGTHPLFADVLSRLVGENTPLYAHQAAVLAHLLSAWRAQRAETKGAAPRLEEHAIGAMFTENSAHQHPLVLTAEGSGRTTLGLLSALLVVLDRGATALVLTRRRDDARVLGRRLETAIERSALRWNLSVAVAGDDLGTQLAAGRIPQIVLTDLESFESELLSDARTDAVLSRLGLLVLDDLDAFVGVPEMHLHVAMRRFWALTRTLRDAPYPLLLLALAGPSAEGMLPWARHLLAAPLSLFDADAAPRRAQIALRRRDLSIDPDLSTDLGVQRAASQREPTVKDLAEAAHAAGLRWHLRLAGDELRRVLRAHIDLEGTPGHVDDPRDADVVILEGRQPDVAREAIRLAHAGIRREGEVVVFLAPPPDEETVLFDPAIDAPERALTASLPRAVSLTLPPLVRQRHFDRALSREHDVDALRERFGRRFVDETLSALAAGGRVIERTVWQFDPRIDDAVPRSRIKSVHGAALGEPIVETTVGESKTRVSLVDEGTAATLGEVDGTIALSLYPPGALFLTASGRYQVRGESDHGGRRAIALVHGRPPLFSNALRHVGVETTGEVEWAERGLGGAHPGKPLRFATARAEITETLSGIRIYQPGALLLERRAYEREVLATYSTQACVVAVSGLAPGGEAPLLSALRRSLPWLVRSAEGALDVEITEVDGERGLVFFDRTPGGSGLASAIEAELLGDALRLARRVLERLVEDQLERLRALFDGRGEGPWDVAAALAFLDGVLDGPSDTKRGEETFGYTPGEGTRGDLGRLWISPSGRTDDLLWVRHPFVLPEAIGSAPAGEVFLDVGIERAEARRETVEAKDDALLFGTLRALLDKIAGDAEGARELALRWVAGLPLKKTAGPARSTPARIALVERRADAAGRAALLSALAAEIAIDEQVARIARGERTLTLDLSERAAVVRTERTP
jgi:hypothetical protein